MRKFLPFIMCLSMWTFAHAEIPGTIDDPELREVLEYLDMKWGYHESTIVDLTGVVNGKVSKTGDTMTGNLIIDGAGLTVGTNTTIGGALTAADNVSISSNLIVGGPLFTVGTTTFVVKNNTVGIGVQTPVDGLDVSYGGVHISSTANANKASSFLMDFLHSGTAPGPGGRLIVYGDSGYDYNSFRLGRANASGAGLAYPFTMYENGNIGIGTMSATAYGGSYPLMVVGPSPQLLVEGESGASAKIFIRPNVTNGWYIEGAITTGYLNIAKEGSDTKLMITDIGRVGIGTTAPGYKLAVAGGTTGPTGGIYAQGESYIGGPITLSTNVYVAGAIISRDNIGTSSNITAAYFYGDGSNLTGIDTDFTGVRYSTDPVSTSLIDLSTVTSAIDLKYDKTGGAISGAVSIATNTTINGALTVNDNIYISSYTTLGGKLTSAYNLNTSSSVSALKYEINGSTAFFISADRTTIVTGIQAGQGSVSLISPYYNTHIGYSAARRSSLAEQNVHIGAFSGEENTSGDANTTVGTLSGQGTSGNAYSHNTFIGHSSGKYVTTGGYNTFMGSATGSKLTTGSRSILIGYGVDMPIGTEDYYLNIGDAIYGTIPSGSLTMPGNITSSSFTATGLGFLGNGSNLTNMTASQIAGVLTTTDTIPLSLVDITTAVTNRFGTVEAALSTAAYLPNTQTFTGVNTFSTNTIVSGALTLNDNLYVSSRTRLNDTLTSAYQITTSSNINANAYQISGSTVLAILPGNSSMFVGSSIRPYSAGNLNTFVGVGVATSCILATCLDNTIIGSQAGIALTGNDNTFIGGQAGYKTNSGIGNIFIGYQSGFNNLTGSSNILIGPSAGAGGTTASNLVAIGNSAGYSNTSGPENTYIGYRAGYANISSGYNTIFGFNAGAAFTSAYNTLIGRNAGTVLTSGERNTFVGANGGAALLIGNENSGCGAYTMFNNTTGQYNALLGYRAGNGAASSSFSKNVIAGAYSGYGLSSGSSNTIVGYYSGYSNTTANNNVLMGYYAGYTITTGTGNIIIGANADTLAPNSNKLVIGGPTPIISGDMTQSSMTLTVNGDFTITGQFLPKQVAAASISALTPLSAGRKIICTDCVVPYDDCTSTGTAPGAWVISGTANHCQ